MVQRMVQKIGKDHMSKTKTFSTALDVDRLTETGRYRDAHPKDAEKGLYLNISKTGTKSWLFRYQIRGTRRWIGLGSYGAANTLSDARKKAVAKRVELNSGIDPLAASRAEEERRKLEEGATEREQFLNQKTFQVCSEEFIQAKSGEWSNPKHRDQWVNTLTTYVYPFIGSKPVKDIVTTDIRCCLDPIWNTKTETATRVRQRIQSVMGYAIAHQYRAEGNPALWDGLLEHSYAAPAKVKAERRKQKGESAHHNALPYAELPHFMKELSGMDGSAAIALKFLILTASRTGEVRLAKWEEIDLEKKQWNIPAERMKAKKEHRVALSDAAVELLSSLPRAGEYVFIGGKIDQPLSSHAMIALLKRMERTDITVHGFRSSFRDYIGEETSFPHRVAEYALAHGLTDSTEKSYARGDMLKKRFEMMNAWASYLAQNKSNVTQITFGKRA
jgi:integrase